jgi:MFS transporter, UMF1 family
MDSKPVSRPLLSWALYDFANTIFSAIVITAYFPLYLTALAGNNATLGAATTGAMILAGLVIPLLGALSDQTGRTKSYLIRTTLLCVIALSFIPLSKNVGVLVLLYAAACFFFHASLVFYNSLLPVVAPPEKQGFASGLGTGLGYFGVVLALPLAHFADKHFGRPSVFWVAAVLFLLFSLPAFFFVPERTVSNPASFRWSLWKTEWARLLRFLEKIRNEPRLLFFFTGNFFVTDALNTLIMWVSVFAREVFHPAPGELIGMLIAINLSAFCAGILAGFMTDRIGSMKLFIFSAALLAASIFILATVPDFKTFMIISVAGGAFAIAGIWTSGRKALVELAPPDSLGEYFGLYGLTTKISVIGSLIFSIIADFSGFRTALKTVAFPATVGLLFLILSHRSWKKKAAL